jgi:diacylglycerol kinase family enzyme
VTRAFIIGRRGQGDTAPEVVREVEKTLRTGGWTTDSVLVSKKRELRRAAASSVKDGYDIVVAVGGDEAVAQAATSLARSPAALGIVPTGRRDLLAGNLGIPSDPTEAAKLILTARKRVIDLGRAAVDGKRRDFLVACGMGYDASPIDGAASDGTDPAATDAGGTDAAETGAGETDGGTAHPTAAPPKLRWGKAAYVANAMARFGGMRNTTHHITLDGEVRTVEASQVFIANFGRMLPVIKPRQAIRPDDGRLDVIVVRASGLVPGLLASWEVVREKSLGFSGGGHVFRARASRIRIETASPRVVEGDGAVIGTTPLKVKVIPRALTVLVRRR